MKKYKVRVNFGGYCTTEIESENENDALNEALEYFDEYIDIHRDIIETTAEVEEWKINTEQRRQK